MIKNFKDFCEKDFTLSQLKGNDKEICVPKNLPTENENTLIEGEDNEDSVEDENPEESKNISNLEPDFDTNSDEVSLTPLSPKDESDLPDLESFLTFVKKTSKNSKIGKPELENLYATKYGQIISKEFLDDSIKGIVKSFNPAKIQESIGNNIWLDFNQTFENLNKFSEEKVFKIQEILEKLNSLKENDKIRFDFLRDVLTEFLGESEAFQFFSVYSTAIVFNENSIVESGKAPKQVENSKELYFLKSELENFFNAIPSNIIQPSELLDISKAISNLDKDNIDKGEVVSIILSEIKDDKKAEKVLIFLNLRK